jgi:uncharacterized protein YgiM (DUF1202 family)
MTRLVSTLSALGIVSALSGVVAAPASAATPGSGSGSTVSAMSVKATSVAAAVCRYSIVGTNVNVRSGPGLRYTPVRVKQIGERVTGPWPCAATVSADDYYWVKLYLGSGGYGWTAEPFLHYIGYFRDSTRTARVGSKPGVD